ncbi:hypothetical protein CC77DRAFT_549007 [Alternaria alternata]|uniref:Uncharacterized protein n=1 Tax=Alternaria alternata TaxID=5599 RepID=A0A177D4Q8_ALTAL|nr:hypothetical protein CC77DRAFT_549007 [Alternaria alternata]OAG14644.1 hypothetical protein CC77DRAFT_549007 [Alternaria alternata]
MLAIGPPPPAISPLPLRFPPPSKQPQQNDPQHQDGMVSSEEENYCSKSQGSTSTHCGATNSRLLHQVIQICWRSGRFRSHFKKNMANAFETVPLPLIVFFAAAIGLCQASANFLRSSGLRPSS